MKVIAIQLLAMITMLIDHIGAIWFPDHSIFRIIGRLAFPLYTYAIVLGYHKTSNLKRYLRRLGLLAVISQLPFMFAFQTSHINVIGTLFICLLLLLVLDRYSSSQPLQLFFTLAVLVLFALLYFDYGPYALMLVLIFRYAAKQWVLPLHFALNIITFITNGWYLQMYSLAASLIIIYMPDFVHKRTTSPIGRIVWQSFYPAHISILAIIYHYYS